MAKSASPTLPTDTDNVTLTVSQREVRLTNLRKPFWPALVHQMRAIQYYMDVAPVLLRPSRRHGMKRYPHGPMGVICMNGPHATAEWIRPCGLSMTRAVMIPRDRRLPRIW